MGLLGAFIGKGEGRGGILEALDRPIMTTVTETFKYGRKGSVNEGKVTEHITKTKEIAVGDILALVIAGGILYVAAEQPFREVLMDIFDPLDILPEIVATTPGFFESLADVLKAGIDPFDLFG